MRVTGKKKRRQRLRVVAAIVGYIGYVSAPALQEALVQLVERTLGS